MESATDIVSRSASCLACSASGTCAIGSSRYFCDRPLRDRPRAFWRPRTGGRQAIAVGETCSETSRNARHWEPGEMEPDETGRFTGRRWTARSDDGAARRLERTPADVCACDLASGRRDKPASLTERWSPRWFGRTRPRTKVRRQDCRRSAPRCGLTQRDRMSVATDATIYPTPFISRHAPPAIDGISCRFT